MTKTRDNPGFTLIELVVAMSVLAILAGTLIPRIKGLKAEARDARRLSDCKAVQAAVEKYFVDHAEYPAANENVMAGGWDISTDGDFIPELVRAGYLTDAPKDPINDETYNYRYYRFAKGTAGCKSDGQFYVLGVKAFETPEFTALSRGQFKCADRDWGTEMAFVCGGGVRAKP